MFLWLIAQSFLGAGQASELHFQPWASVPLTLHLKIPVRFASTSYFEIDSLGAHLLPAAVRLSQDLSLEPAPFHQLGRPEPGGTL